MNKFSPPRIAFPVALEKPPGTRLREHLIACTIQNLRQQHNQLIDHVLDTKVIQPGQALKLYLSQEEGEWDYFWALVNALGVPLTDMNFESDTSDCCWAFLHSRWVSKYIVLARMWDWDPMIQNYKGQENYGTC
jgi:hypothetical protein